MYVLRESKMTTNEKVLSILFIISGVLNIIGPRIEYNHGFSDGISAQIKSQSQMQLECIEMSSLRRKQILKLKPMNIKNGELYYCNDCKISSVCSSLHMEDCK